MATQDDIQKHEAEINNLKDARWSWLMEQRRIGKERELEQCKGERYAAEISETIESGYLNTLGCILSCAAKFTGQ
jgi:hypothetical protein